jgi:hypothetical protein
MWPPVSPQSKKAIQSLRLRLRFSLRQSGKGLWSGFYGTVETVPFRFRVSTNCLHSSTLLQDQLDLQVEGIVKRQIADWIDIIPSAAKAAVRGCPIGGAEAPPFQSRDLAPSKQRSD